MIVPFESIWHYEVIGFENIDGSPTEVLSEDTRIIIKSSDGYQTRMTTETLGQKVQIGDTFTEKYIRQGDDPSDAQLGEDVTGDKPGDPTSS